MNMEVHKRDLFFVVSMDMYRRDEVSADQKRLPRHVRFQQFASWTGENSHVELMVASDQGPWSRGESFMLSRNNFLKIYTP